MTSLVRRRMTTSSAPTHIFPHPPHNRTAATPPDPPAPPAAPLVVHGDATPLARRRLGLEAVWRRRWRLVRRLAGCSVRCRVSILDACSFFPDPLTLLLTPGHRGGEQTPVRGGVGAMSTLTAPLPPPPLPVPGRVVGERVMGRRGDGRPPGLRSSEQAPGRYGGGR